MSLKRYSLFVLIYNIFVILLGAVVRATGSGAGCGSHWPSCNGEVIPTAPEFETFIEFSHRLTSGLSIIFIIILFIWVYRSYNKGTKIRKAAFFVLFFIAIEAAIGAGLVLFDLVADNSSVYRAVVISVHLINTFLLLGSNVLLFEWIRFGEPKQMIISKNGRQIFFLIFILFLALGASGAITALGDTLFPAASLSEGLKQDIGGENFLLQLRVYHPMIALVIGLAFYVIYTSFLSKSKNQRMNRYFKLMAGLFVLQLLIGVVNVLLLAPIWMQIIHLLMADLIWVIFVLWVNQIIYFGLSPLSHD